MCKACRYIGISRQAYYQRLGAQQRSAERDAQIQRLVLDVRLRQPRIGTRKLHHLLACPLKAAGIKMGRDGLFDVLRRARLLVAPRRAYHKTTDSHHRFYRHPNLLKEGPGQIVPTGPEQVWVADITYLPTGQGWLYLAAVLDLYSRKIVGWALSPRLDTELVLQALAMALTHRHPPAGLVFHSDRGVQYASTAFRAALDRAGLLPSMSRRANCYDNAAMESFWSTLKLELIYRQEFATHAQIRAAVFDYIEAFYNRQRAHSALGYLSPTAFETQKH